MTNICQNIASSNVETQKIENSVPKRSFDVAFLIAPDENSNERNVRPKLVDSLTDPVSNFECEKWSGSTLAKCSVTEMVVENAAQNEGHLWPNQPSFGLFGNIFDSLSGNIFSSDFTKRDTFPSTLSNRVHSNSNFTPNGDALPANKTNRDILLTNENISNLESSNGKILLDNFPVMRNLSDNTSNRDISFVNLSNRDNFVSNLSSSTPSTFAYRENVSFEKSNRQFPITYSKYPSLKIANGGTFSRESSPLDMIAPCLSPYAAYAFLPDPLFRTKFSHNLCAKCGNSFRMTSDLVYHMRSHHKNDNSTSSNGTIYKRRQDVEKRLRCEVCNELFKEKHHLTRHMTAHRDEEGEEGYTE